MPLLLVNQRQPDTALKLITVGRFLSDQEETNAIFAASNATVHLYRVEIHNNEDIIIPLDHLNVYGSIVAVGSLPITPDHPCDLPLALLSNGQLGIFTIRHGR